MCLCNIHVSITWSCALASCFRLLDLGHRLTIDWIDFSGVVLSTDNRAIFLYHPLSAIQWLHNKALSESCEPY